MGSNAKLYVLAKKEAFFIFLFVVAIAIFSFSLGIKIGKQYNYEKAGYEKEDKDKVEFLSSVEEDANKLLDNNKIGEKALENERINSISEEISKEFSGKKEKIKRVPKIKKLEEVADTSSLREGPVRYTLYLGSFRTQEEARDYSKGFKVRGYNPIIRRVNIKNRGIWYRVSLGSFLSTSAAKEYVAKENSLFEGQDYFIGRL